MVVEPPSFKLLSPSPPYSSILEKGKSIGYTANNQTNINIILTISILACFLYDIRLGIASLFFIIVIYKWNQRMKGFIINLDKNPERLNRTLDQCAISGLSNRISIERFPAIDGKKVHLEDWVSPDTFNEIENIERMKYRTHHYQLTKGGVGCFLSHYRIAKNLIGDILYDHYLILEDDITIEPRIYDYITQSLNDAPPDWDILLFSWIRMRANDSIEPSVFKKVDSFWGMQCYMINTKGANKVTEEVERNKIDGQIDSYLSRMVQQNKLNIYAFKRRMVYTDSRTTDIQLPIHPVKTIDPFDYKGCAT